MSNENEHTVKCRECGAPTQAPKGINYYLCSSCKHKLEATPKKIMEHAVRASEENTYEHVRD